MVTGAEVDWCVAAAVEVLVGVADVGRESDEVSHGEAANRVRRGQIIFVLIEEVERSGAEVSIHRGPQLASIEDVALGVDASDAGGLADDKLAGIGQIEKIKWGRTTQDGRACALADRNRGGRKRSSDSDRRENLQKIEFQVHAGLRIVWAERAAPTIRSLGKGCGRYNVPAVRGTLAARRGGKRVRTVRRRERGRGAEEPVQSETRFRIRVVLDDRGGCDSRSARGRNKVRA